MLYNLTCWYFRAVGTCWGLGGGGAKKFCADYFCITLIFQKDPIEYISISVIYNIH